MWEIVDARRAFDSVAAMVDATDLTERQIRLALGYHERFPAEIDDAIARNRRSLEDLRAEYPTIEVATVSTR